MARLFSLPLHLQQTASGVENPSSTRTIGSSGAFAHDLTVLRNGYPMVEVSQGGTAGASYYTATIAGATGRNTYLRMALYIEAAPPSACTIARFFRTAGPSSIAYAVLQTDRTITLHDENNTQIGSASPALNLNQQYVFEMMIRVETVANTGDLIARLDGTDFVSALDTVDMNTAAPTSIRFGIVSSTISNWSIWLADLAVNDDQGASENSWCGHDRKTAMLLPAGDSAIGNWQNGANGTTNLWDAVDNNPPTGVGNPTTATQQIQNNNAAGNDNYDATMEAYEDATGGPQSGDIIKVVEALSQIGSNTATDTAGGMQVVSGGPEADAGITWTTFDNGSAGTSPAAWLNKRSGPFYGDVADKSTQPVLRMTKTTATTREVYADFMGLYVEYEPAPVQDVFPAATPADEESYGATLANVAAQPLAPGFTSPTEESFGATLTQQQAANPAFTPAQEESPGVEVAPVPPQDANLAFTAPAGESPGVTVVALKTANLAFTEGRALSYGATLVAVSVEGAPPGNTDTIGQDTPVTFPPPVGQDFVDAWRATQMLGR